MSGSFSGEMITESHPRAIGGQEYDCIWLGLKIWFRRSSYPNIKKKLCTYLLVRKHLRLGLYSKEAVLWIQLNPQLSSIKSFCRNSKETPTSNLASLDHNSHLFLRFSMQIGWFFNISCPGEKRINFLLKAESKHQQQGPMRQQDLPT